MATKEPRIGLLGGTFNPVHHGHLLIAQEALARHDLRQVLLIPNRCPPHRAGEPALASSEHRWAMVKLATASVPGLGASRIELDREGPSYTVDTVEALKGGLPGTGLYFITGADALMKYAWKDLDRLLSHLDAFLVATRPGFSFETLRERLAPLQLANARRIVELPLPGIEISSTLVRERLSTGAPIHELVPRPVEAYIFEHGLYGARQSGGQVG